MKAIGYIIFFLSYSLLTTHAQMVKKIAEEPIETGEKEIAKLFAGKISPTVKIVGIGDVAFLSHEPAKFNAALMAYLIEKQNFKRISIAIDDWVMRPLNAYLLNSKAAPSKQITDSLTKVVAVRTPYHTTEFQDFIVWLKEYNLGHRQQPVSFAGIGLENRIPASYFLSTYILPIDKTSGLALSQKWAAYNYPDSSMFHDVLDWCSKITTNSNESGQDASLLLLCNEDIQHNKDLNEMALLVQKNTPDNYIFLSNHYANDVIKKDGEKGIFYFLNQHIAKANILFMNGDKKPSTGLLLYNKLKDAYFACLTDFADTAVSTVVNIQQRKYEMDTAYGKLQAQNLLMKKDYFFATEDSSLLKGYLPNSLPLFKGQKNTISLDKNTLPQDALFLLKNLTPVAYLGKK